MTGKRRNKKPGQHAKYRAKRNKRKRKSKKRQSKH